MKFTLTGKGKVLLSFLKQEKRTGVLQAGQAHIDAQQSNEKKPPGRYAKANREQRGE